MSDEEEPVDDQPDQVPDEIPDWVAQFDQWRKGAADFAKVVALYHRALLEEGIDPVSAVMLTNGYQAAVLGVARNG